MYSTLTSNDFFKSIKTPRGLGWAITQIAVFFGWYLFAVPANEWNFNLWLFEFKFFNFHDIVNSCNSDYAFCRNDPSMLIGRNGNLEALSLMVNVMFELEGVAGSVI